MLIYTGASNEAFGGYKDSVIGSCAYSSWSLSITTNIKPIIKITGIVNP
jgi:acyl-CoA reductase-like NAD-dependent aldehyde dehydrogenase